jgi:DNA-directed RNA polymerase subunit RPC12/RpoP
MLKGMTLFKCTECGNRFIAPDIELGATALSAPQKCPKCGSMRTRPYGGSDFMYKGIWSDQKKTKE